MTWVQLIVMIIMMIVSYLLQPKPKKPAPAAVQDIEDPTASADRPIPVLFGTKIVKPTNVIAVMDRSQRTYEVAG